MKKQEFDRAKMIATEHAPGMLPVFHEVEKLRAALSPFVDACVGKWTTGRKPNLSDTQVGLITSASDYWYAKKLMEDFNS